MGWNLALVRPSSLCPSESGQCHPTNRFFCPSQRIAPARARSLAPERPAQRLFFLTSQTRRRFRTYSALSAIVAKTSRRVAGKTNGETETIYCGLCDSFGLDEREQQHHDIYSVLLSPLPPSLPASSRCRPPGGRGRAAGQACLN